VEAHCPPGSYPEQWDIEGLHDAVRDGLNLELPFADWVKEEAVDQDMFSDRTLEALDAIMGPKADGMGEEGWRQVEKNFLLQSLDHHWKEHLATLDALRQVVHLRAYAQKTPLNEYKAEAFALFERMLKLVREDVTRMLAFAQFNWQPESFDLPEMPDFLKLDGNGRGATPASGMFGAPGGGTFGLAAPAGAFAMGDPLSADEALAARSVAELYGPDFVPEDPDTWQRTVSRNAQCPCGSAKKFKHCHGLIG
jgi:preprotein translocase subunit SecA